MKLWTPGLLAWPAHSGVQAPFRFLAAARHVLDGEDARLVAAAKYGAGDAFEALIEHYAPRLHAVARRLVGDDLAADMVQETFVAAHKGLRRFGGRSSFSTWLHSILIHRCRRAGRRRKPVEPLADSLASTSKGPETLAENSLLRSRLAQALDELPEPFRVALSLREFSELSYEEIAGVLGVSLGTVKSRIARGRAQLREIVEREGIRL